MTAAKYTVKKPLVNATVGTHLVHRQSTPHRTAGLYTEDGKIIVLWCHIDQAIEQGFIENIMSMPLVAPRFWVTNHDAPEASRRVSGPYTTAADAGRARDLLERLEGHNNYWVEELEED